MIQTALAVSQASKCAETFFAESKEGPSLKRRSLVFIYQGDLEGEGVLEELQVLFSPKRSVLTGVMRFTGRVGDFKGNCVLKHTGKVIQGRTTLVQTVVPGSATGQLKGLRGELRYDGNPAEKCPAVFRYRFA